MAPAHSRRKTTPPRNRTPNLLPPASAISSKRAESKRRSLSFPASLEIELGRQYASTQPLYLHESGVRYRTTIDLQHQLLRRTIARPRSYNRPATISKHVAGDCYRRAARSVGIKILFSEPEHEIRPFGLRWLQTIVALTIQCPRDVIHNLDLRTDREQKMKRAREKGRLYKFLHYA